MDTDQIDTDVGHQQLLVTPSEALYSPQWLALPAPLHPEQAARLRIARGTYPLPTVLVGRRRMVRTADIQNYVARLATSGQSVSGESKFSLIVHGRRAVGRPRKVAAPGGAP